MKQEQTNYLKSIKLLPKQIEQSYLEANKIKFPQSYHQINKIVCCGMGGSQLGVDFIKHLFAGEIKVPIIQVRGYNLPRFVDDKTLVVLISYSGNTEEVLSIISKLKTRNSKQIKNPNFQNSKIKFVIITSGGRLAEMARQQNIPVYIFNPINNPSKQPRMGTGYIIGALLSILKRLNLSNIEDKQITTLFKQQTTNNKQQTTNLKNKIPIIVASEFLQGVAHITANQINESAKQLALYYFIPELNHHLLEGLTFPKENKKLLNFIFLFSKNYHPRNQKRYKITQEVLRKQKISYRQIEFKGDKVSQAMEMLMFGSYLSYELSRLNKANPNEIPWVDYFKKRLS